MPAGNTYTQIASTTLGTAASSVTFSSIPATYTDLILGVSGIYASGGGSSVSIRFNSDTATNYSVTWIYGGAGASPVSSKVSNVAKMDIGYMSGAAQGNTIANIQNYSNSTTNKTVISRGGVTSDLTIEYVGLWRNTAAITSITTLIDSGVNYAAGCTFNLYGITAA